MSELKLIVDIRSMSEGGQLIARTGTVVDFLNDEDGYVVAQLKDGSIAFPLFEGEYEAIDNGEHVRHETAEDENALRFNRGKKTR